MAPVCQVQPWELKQVLPVVRSFFDEGQFPGTWKDEHWLNFWHGIITAKLGCMFIGPAGGREVHGALAAFCTPSHVNGDLCAQEVFWYVLPEHRGGRLALQLFNAFEKWAAEQGARTITVGHLAAINPDQMRRFYEKRGYHLLEHHYLKTT